MDRRTISSVKAWTFFAVISWEIVMTFAIAFSSWIALATPTPSAAPMMSPPWAKAVARAADAAATPLSASAIWRAEACAVRAAARWASSRAVTAVRARFSASARPVEAR